MHQRQWAAHRSAHSCVPPCCSGAAPPAPALPQVCPAIEELVTQLEGCWRSVLPEDQFGLYELDEASVLLLYCCTCTVAVPLPPRQHGCCCTAALSPHRCCNTPSDPLFPPCLAPIVYLTRVPYCLQRFKYLDSLDPEGTDPFAFRSMRDPAKGQPGYPRLQVGAVLCCAGQACRPGCWWGCRLLEVCWRCWMVLW
jgi:hypothetical protein